MECQGKKGRWKGETGDWGDEDGGLRRDGDGAVEIMRWAQYRSSSPSAAPHIGRSWRHSSVTPLMLSA